MHSEDPRDFGAGRQNDDEEFRITHEEEEDLFGFGFSHWTTDEESHEGE